MEKETEITIEAKSEADLFNFLMDCLDTIETKPAPDKED